MARKLFLVGGFGGSYLVFGNGPRENQDVWFDESFLLRNGPDAMHLSAAGTGPGALTDGTPLVAGGLLQFQSNYKALFQRLDKEGWRVYPFSYDWRKDLRSFAQQLSEEFQAFSDGEDTWVLAYSMGGLIARLAYPLYKARVGDDRWKRTVYVGTPHYGAHAAALGLAGPSFPAPLTGQLVSALSEVVGKVKSLGKKPGRKKRLDETVASWPALYQLLPSITPAFLQTRQLDAKLYERASYLGDNDFVSTAHFGAALATRTALDASLAGPRPPEVCVIGIGVATPDALTDVKLIGKDLGYRQNFTGDGAVTVERGTLPGTKHLTIPGSEHTATLGDGRFLSRVTDLLLNGLGDDQTTPRPVVVVQDPGSIKDLVIVPQKPFPDYPVRGDP